MKIKGVNFVVAVDPGDTTSGIALLSEVQVLTGSVVSNESLFDVIKEYVSVYSATVVIEDMKPYSVRLSPQVIETTKFIGVLSYRLKNELSIFPVLEGRHAVKEWIYNQHPRVCIPRIMKKIELLHEKRVKQGKRGLQNQDGEMRAPSFVFVDDRIVIAAMKEHWGIPTPKVGKSNIYGLKSHSWQALAIGTYYLRKKRP